MCLLWIFYVYYFLVFERRIATNSISLATSLPRQEGRIPFKTNISKFDVYHRHRLKKVDLLPSSRDEPTCTKTYVVSVGGEDTCDSIAIRHNISTKTLILCTNSYWSYYKNRRLLLDMKDCNILEGDLVCLRCSSTHSRMNWTLPHESSIQQITPERHTSELIGIALDDTTIRKAVYEWIYNKTHALMLYKHISLWNTSLVTNMESLFDRYYINTSRFNENLSNWDTSRVTTMRCMFYSAALFNGTVSAWNTSLVTNMSSLFYGASSFNGDVSTWDTSRVNTMESMFYNAALFNGVVSTWNTSLVTDMSSLFYGASSFNGDVSSWDTSRVNTMESMLGRLALFNGDVSAWNTSLVTNMSSLFYGASSFNGDVSTWDTSRVNTMKSMFYIAAFFNGTVSAWNTSLVTNMSFLFYGAYSFNGDVSSWDLSRVNDMYAMFYNSILFNGTVSAWNTSLVTDMSFLFYGASSFNGDMSSWDLSRVNNMYAMFYNTALFNGAVSAWNTSLVTDMSFLFYGASSFNDNVNVWDISKVTDMQYLFYRASSFNGDLSTWNTSQVTNMKFMFWYASSFNTYIGMWETSRVTNMASMFVLASSFNSPVLLWKTSKVTDMNRMFANASSFNGNVARWDTSNVSNMSYMYFGAKSFKQILCWNTSTATTDHIFDGSNGLFSTVPYPYCLFITTSPSLNPIQMPTTSPYDFISLRPTKRQLSIVSNRPTHRPSINLTNQKWSPWFGSALGNYTNEHRSCPEGSKVIAVNGLTSDWIHQLSATCNDENKTVLGPLGSTLNGLLDNTTISCDKGFYGFYISSNVFVGRIKFLSDCSQQSIGKGLSFGYGVEKSFISRNQSVVGFQVYFNQSGVLALSVEFIPWRGKRYDSFGEPTGDCPSKRDWLAVLWGFLTIMVLVLFIGSIIACINRRQQRAEFERMDTFLQL